MENISIEVEDVDNSDGFIVLTCKDDSIIMVNKNCIKTMHIKE